MMFRAMELCGSAFPSDGNGGCMATLWQTKSRNNRDGDERPRWQ